MQLVLRFLVLRIETQPKQKLFEVNFKAFSSAAVFVFFWFGVIRGSLLVFRWRCFLKNDFTCTGAHFSKIVMYVFFFFFFVGIPETAV